MLSDRFKHVGRSDYAEKARQSYGVATIGTRYCYRGTLLVVSRIYSCAQPGLRYHAASRGSITGFTQSSATRMRNYLQAAESEYVNMVTLTYPSSFPSDGPTVKNHLRRFLQELRRKTERDRDKRIQFSAFWFLEFQQRGAPHFHVFITHSYEKEFIAKLWYNICGTDDIRHLHAGTRIEKIRAGRGGVISYAMKYAAKTDQKEVPQDYNNVGRFWGIHGNRATVAAAISFLDEEKEKCTFLRKKTQVLVENIKSMIETKYITLTYTKPGLRVFRIDNCRVVPRLNMLFSDIEHERNLTKGELFQKWIFSDAELW